MVGTEFLMLRLTRASKQCLPGLWGIIGAASACDAFQACYNRRDFTSLAQGALPSTVNHNLAHLTRSPVQTSRLDMLAEKSGHATEQRRAASDTAGISESAKSGSLQERMARAGWTRQEVLNAPNAVSMARLLSGPPIAALIVYQMWAPALVSLAVSGASDWLDGYLARRWGQGSRLGTYLDPIADKVLICCTVGALGAEGSLPLPVAAIIMGRDMLLIGGAFLHRAHSLGWRRMGLDDFFRLAPSAEFSHAGAETGQHDAMASQGNQKAQQAAPVAEMVQPLWISKVNTGLQLSLVGACITSSWYAWPPVEGLWLLIGATGLTTAASGIAYARQFLGQGTRK